MWYPRLQPPSLMPIIRGHHHCHYGYQQVAIKVDATTVIAINKLALRSGLQPPSLMLTYVTQWTRLTYTTTTTINNDINSSIRHKPSMFRLPNSKVKRSTTTYFALCKSSTTIHQSPKSCIQLKEAYQQYS